MAWLIESNEDDVVGTENEIELDVTVNENNYAYNLVEFLPESQVPNPSNVRGKCDEILGAGSWHFVLHITLLDSQKYEGCTKFHLKPDSFYSINIDPTEVNALYVITDTGGTVLHHQKTKGKVSNEIG